MPLADEHKEEKVQKALQLLRENPGMKITKAVQQTRTIYDRIRRRLNSTLRSVSRGGHNKKLNVPSTAALKEFLLIYYTLGQLTNIENVVVSTNSILQLNGEEGTMNRK